ncbi:MAG: Eco57I restriction-modification methylase domain-containing protein [Bacteroidales bacterium]|jgi:site-specific DNA-methyltransferase (adenine-specific)|nr:Eco57I restriction-modification methylase domain-containing protein [Bacteroidales bacterium]
MSNLELIAKNYNPDILSCLANLSNDEVFTPPELANKMLDLLPQDIFRDKSTVFLDPACKSGVFLREIAKRLLVGLEHEFPNLENRIDHIFKKQIYGIAVTELTSLLSRRTVYCSKFPNSKYSITIFDNAEGNIRFKNISHTWKYNNCIFCGVNKSIYDRDKSLEAHAYEFIHRDIEDDFPMKFDVIIGNPPYQLNDGGFGRSATPVYHKFVEQAIKLNPRYLIMIIPSRWFAGGKGLDVFRSNMLKDTHIKKFIDFENATECFPGVDLAGGVGYFLWDREYNGNCQVTNIVNGISFTSLRSLDEFHIFIRNSRSVPIIRKVMQFKEQMMSEIVSSRKPFGLATNVEPEKKGDLVLRHKNGEGFYQRSKITVGIDMIDKYKVICAKTAYDHAGNPDKDGKRKVFSSINVLPPGSICSETYLVVGSFETEYEANNLRQYLKTHFVRFLMTPFLISQDITKERFAFVPTQDFSQQWTDKNLYLKYSITIDEIAFIESLIRPME